MNKQKYYNIVNEPEKETADIYIEGEIVEEGWEREFIETWFGNHATASNEFADMLKELNGKDLIIHCNSFGGSLFAGTAMYAALLEYKGKKTGYIGSMCASAATFPMLACDKTYMSAASGYCAHLPMTFGYFEGNRIDIQETYDNLIKDLTAVENVMISAYQKKTGMSATQIKNILEKDEVINAEDAIKYGFVDGYTEDVQNMITLNKSVIDSMFKHNVMIYNSLKPKQPSVNSVKLDNNTYDFGTLSVCDSDGLSATEGLINSCGAKEKEIQDEIKAQEEKENQIKTEFEFLSLKK